MNRRGKPLPRVPMSATTSCSAAAVGIAARDNQLVLFGLIGWFKYFREQRQRENLNQAELLKQELRLLGSAILVIATLIGLVFVLIWIHER